MRNYIIINGVSSTLIKGLLIESLPKVTKPAIRTRREEVDGRDGDLVEYLGFSAYDKDFKIGLFGDYDINAVIEYFNSKGQIIFSNEPDKYYEFEIIEAIDFERLLKFREATVKLHCQPFKYSAVTEHFEIELNKIRLKPYLQTTHGISVISDGEKISITGTSTAITSVYIPIEKVNLLESTYKLTLISDGSVGDSEIRIIREHPTDSESLGAGSFALIEGTEIIDNLESSDLEINYIYFELSSGQTVDFDLTLDLKDTINTDFIVVNQGNIESKPIITIYGDGIIYLYVNDVEAFSLNMQEYHEITLNSVEMNAYNDESLLNRYVYGDFKKLSLKKGRNILNFDGNVDKIELSKISRWI